MSLKTVERIEICLYAMVVSLLGPLAILKYPDWPWTRIALCLIALQAVFTILSPLFTKGGEK